MSDKETITKFTKTGGKLCKECKLHVVKSSQKSKTVAVRWTKTDKGGEIRLNVVGLADNESTNIVLNDKSEFVMDGPTKLSFYKNIDLVVDAQVPDCVAILKFKDNKHGRTLVCYIPFITGEKITAGSDTIHRIVKEVVTYQANEGDPASQLKDMNVLDLFPDKGGYYEGYASTGAPNKNSKTSDVIIVINTFQAILTDDMKLLEKLFDIDTADIPTIRRLPGKKINISSYNRSDNPITEGLTNMSSNTGPDDIYIDCHPVGVDEETEQVTVKYDKSDGSQTQSQLLYIILAFSLVIIVMTFLYGINYFIREYLA